ncbi:MAG: HlyD family secretion protein [Pseudomonadota bacterium]|nr:HlyD family secretion protein [Pseudomonadota bacterium]
MSQELFRREALEARRTSWLGGVSLAQPVSIWIMTGAAAVAALAVALFLTFATYTRRSSVVGRLVPTQGLAMVLAPATGVISSVDIPEGGAVQAGDTLVVVAVPQATLAGGDTVIALEQRLQERQAWLELARDAQLQRLDAQQAGLESQLVSAQRELLQAEDETTTRQERVAIARQTLERLHQLRRDRYVSDLQVKEQEAEVLDLVGALQGSQRQVLGARRGIVQVRQSLRELPGQRLGVEASYRRDVALLGQEQVETRARGALAVASPVTGVVATKLVKPGQAVRAGQPLLSVLPGDGRLEAELLVRSRAIGFVAPGDKVLLRYQAYPYQKFGHQRGRVARISRSALGPSELGALIGSPQGDEPLYRVTVTLGRQAITAYGKQEALKPGMLLEADILGERRKLIEWIFEPLYSIKGKLRE